jgi:iron complex outermembrane recepter protein
MKSVELRLSTLARATRDVCAPSHTSVKPALALVATMVFAGSAFAQQTPPAQPKVEKIEVTGSNIKRVDAETASPIQIITAEEMRATGKQTITEILRILPSAAQGGLNDLTGANSFSSGASTVSLRGLGSASTLVLLNGRRIAPYGLADPNFGQSAAVNLDAIPFDAVERIEILKDGASAIYGSEAIAGVINIILRKDFKGGIVSLRGQTNLEGQYNTGNASASIGFGDLAKDRYNLFVNLEGFKREQVTFRESEEFLNRNEYSSSTRYRTGQRAFSSYAPQLNIFPFTFFDPSNLSGAFIASISPASGARSINACPAGQQRAGESICRYDTFSDLETVPKSQRANVFARGTFDLSGTTSLFAEASFNQIKTTYVSAPQVAGDFGFWFASATNRVINMPEVLPPNHPNNPTGDFVGYRYRFSDVGKTGVEVKSDTARVVVGGRTTLGKWDLEAGAMYNQNDTDVTAVNQIRTSVLTNAILNGTYNFANPSAGSVRADQLRVNSKDTAKSSFGVVDFKASTEFGSLPGGPIGFAAGLEYRRENRVATPDVLKTTGEIVGYGAAGSDGDRNVFSAFAELRLPILKNLEVQLAGRTDRYSDYGRSSIPKIGAAWAVSPSFKLRGTYAEGFRAPSLTEITKSSVSAFTTVEDPILCIDGNQNQCFQNIGLLIEANPNVRPETAKSYSGGFVLDVAKDVSVSVDYYRIARKNEINILSLSEILNNETSNDPRYRGRVVRGAVPPGQPVGDIQAIRTGFFNFGSTVTSGVDVDLRAAFSLGEWGRVNSNLVVSYTDKYIIQPEAGAAYVSLNGFRDFPRNRASWTNRWEKGNWNTFMIARYMSGFKTYNSGDATAAATCGSNAAGSVYLGYCRVSEQLTFDLGTEYRGFKNLVVSLTAQNVGNLRPSGDPLARPVNQEWFSAAGTYFTLGARYTFR